MIDHQEKEFKELMLRYNFAKRTLETELDILDRKSVV